MQDVVEVINRISDLAIRADFGGLSEWRWCDGHSRSVQTVDDDEGDVHHTVTIHCSSADRATAARLMSPQRTVLPQARPVPPRAAVAPQKFTLAAHHIMTSQLFLWQHRSAATGKPMANARANWQKKYSKGCLIASSK